MTQTKKRRKLFSVTLDDCRVDTFTVGGNGGSGKDTSNTGVRITHTQSGAVGKSTDTRSQSKNKLLAFKRMSETKEFKGWVRLCAAKLEGTPTVESLVDEAMKPENLKIEVREGDKWVEKDVN